MNLKQWTEAQGFSRAYVLRPEKFVHYQRRLQDGALHLKGAGLCADPGKEYPWANALLVLVMPYRPCAEGVPLSGYYLASNAAYHGAGAAVQALADEGIRAERVYVPLRELLLNSGFGVPLKNGLTELPSLGTRYAAQTLMAALPEPVDYQHGPYAPLSGGEYDRGCQGCGACQKACPAGAIDEEGFHFQRCIRAFMDGEPMEGWVMDAMTAMLGCEICQFACPRNACIPAETALPQEFGLERLLSGDVKPALALVGKNENRMCRLIQHGAVMAGKSGRTELLPLLDSLMSHRHAGVRVAAEYAISLLRKGKN